MTDVAQQRLALARHLLDTASYDRAGEVLDGIAADAIDLEEFWCLRAELARARGDDGARVIETARAGLARFPTSLPLLLRLSDGWVDAGDLARAEEALLAALAEAPEDIASLCRYARVCAQAGQFDKARRLADRAAALEPEAVAVIVARYQIAHFAGDDRETARLAAELAGATGGSSHALALVGLESLKRGDARGAMDVLGRAAGADIRVVESMPETFRAARVATHPLLWPLWPVERFGPAPVWMAAVGTIYALRAVTTDAVAGVFAGVYLVWVVYTWIAPPLVRRWVLGGPS